MERRKFMTGGVALLVLTYACDFILPKRKMRRINNTLHGIADIHTGEYFTYSKVTTWVDGSDMTDKKCDGTIFRKIGNEYFKRDFSGPADVKWFGAKGNGLADDTASIQKAIESYPSIFLSNGEYKLTAQLNITSDKFTLSGNGKSSILITTGQIGSLLYITAHQVTISNLRFTATSKVFGVNIQGTDKNRILQPTITGCYFDKLRDSAIRAQYADSVTIKDIEASDISGSTKLGVFSIDYTASASLSNLTITNGTVKGISALRSTQISYTNVKVNGVVTSDALGPGFSIGLYIGYNCSDVAVTNCEVKGTTEACLKTSEGAHNISIKDCTFQNLTGNNNGNAVLIQGSQKVIVNNCTINTLLSKGINVQYHTAAYDASDVLVTGNSVKSLNSKGIYIFSAQQVSVTNNQLSGTNIHLENCAANILVSNNVIISDRYYDNSVIGIYLYRTSGATIQANTIKAGPAGAVFFSGIYATTNIDQAKILDNDIQITSANTGSSGITVSYAEGVDVGGNVISSPIGINLNALTRSNLENNRVSSINKGIHISSSCDVLLVENNRVTTPSPGSQIVSKATNSIIGNNRIL